MSGEIPSDEWIDGAREILDEIDRVARKNPRSDYGTMGNPTIEEWQGLVRKERAVRQGE